jgi:hypothetical protein
LLKVPVIRINDKRIRQYLWTAMPQQGFQDYITKRDMQLLQHIGIGVPHDEYLTLLGQRIELGLLLLEAKKAFQRVEKDRQEHIEALKKVQTRKIIPQKNEVS